jgi:AcrR family transcriptional regulator
MSSPEGLTSGTPADEHRTTVTPTQPERTTAQTAPQTTQTVAESVRRALLDAAHEVLAREGPAALTVRRIANEAGMSTMNVYSRFGGKDGVVDELYADGFRRLLAAMEEVEPTDDAIDDLLRCGRSYRRFALANPTYYAVMFQQVIDFEPSPASRETALHTLMALGDRVRRAMDAGGVVEADPFEIAACMWAACHGAVSLELGGATPEGVEWPAVFETTIRIVVAGLKR